jgi:hypothetical protein
VGPLRRGHELRLLIRLFVVEVVAVLVSDAFGVSRLHRRDISALTCCPCQLDVVFTTVRIQMEAS